MDLKTRKLNIIERLINLHDEILFSKIEALIHDKTSSKKEFQQFTEEQLIDRAKLSNKDFSEGRVMSQEELEERSEKW